jgi:putative transcriptional regulator
MYFKCQENIPMPAQVPIPLDELDERSKERLEKLKEGCVLLSQENLQDPNFAATVVLICAHTKDGAYGLVVNRPAHMPLSEVFSAEDIIGDERRTFHMGGPVRQEVMQLLQVTETPRSNSYQIAPKVHLGGDWSSLDDILGADPSTTMLFLGYAGWAPGQLEAEIIQDAWEVFQVDLSRLLMTKEKKLYGAVTEIREFLKSISLN